MIFLDLVYTIFYIVYIDMPAVIDEPVIQQMFCEYALLSPQMILMLTSMSAKILPIFFKLPKEIGTACISSQWNYNI